MPSFLCSLASPDSVFKNNPQIWELQSPADPGADRRDAALLVTVDPSVSPEPGRSYSYWGLLLAASGRPGRFTNFQRNGTWTIYPLPVVRVCFLVGVRGDPPPQTPLGWEGE